MAEVFTPIQLVTLTNDTSAVNAVNQNFTAIATALNDVLSRSGVSPNQMNSSLDMNGNQVLNLPPPSTQNSAARLTDVLSGIQGTVPNTGTSGHVVPFLDGSNSWSNTQTFNAGTIFTFSPVFSSDIAIPFGVVGVTNGSNAITGTNGEFVSSNIGFGSAVPLTSNTPANVTSITLTAGDWDIDASAYYKTNSTTNLTLAQFSISTTSATQNLASPFYSQMNWNPSSGIVMGVNTFNLTTPRNRVSISATTTYYLVVNAVFTVATMSAFGYLAARRIR